jgi:hypothetical protein
MLKQACPEEILNQVQNDTFRVQHGMFGPGIFVIPNLIRDLGFGLWAFEVLKADCFDGMICYSFPLLLL